MRKARQLSLFSDKQVERSALCRSHHNPTKEVLRTFRMENIYGVQMLQDDRYGARWNVLRHRTGARSLKTIKVGQRYFYE